MKNSHINLHILPLMLAALMLVLCGCESGEKEPVYDAGTYSLSSVTVDGVQSGAESVYPSGGWLLLSSPGTGRLVLGRNACDVSWTGSGDDFSLSFEGMKAGGTLSGSEAVLTFEGTGMTLTFSSGDYTAPADDGAEAALPGDAICGSWEGTLWFEDPDGEWSDHEYRSLEISGTVIPGLVSLSSPYFSEDIPLVSVTYESEGGSFRSTGGYVMSYPVHDWDMLFDLSRGMRDSLRSTVIIEFPGDYGHVFTPEASEYADEGEIDILRLSGKCRDADGSFGYLIELTRAQ